MRILGGWSDAGWCVICALLSVCAFPLREKANEMHYIGRSRSSDSKSMANGYGFGEISASKSSEIVEDSLEELGEDEEEEEEEEIPPTMRAITARAKSDVALLPLIIEPEAEMLPPGYKGVKPPGVSHMELVFVKPQTGQSDHRRSAMSYASPTGEGNFDIGESDGFDQDRDAYYAASKHEAQITRNDRGGDRRVVFETAVTGDTKKQSERSERTQSSGKGKNYSESENHAKEYVDGIAGKKDVAYESGDSREKARNAAGYRNVYQKDEMKKDADFYDNGRQGGHFEKHGRYGEKYAAAEGMYETGGSNDSRLVKTKTNKRRKLEKARAN
ncbi:uncharacterized protein LOC116850216 [Odontomachus brunneus]|uniref:uncharacterized protein LOC116850216 n=1 Tax=Odontomachus brunneus TaxID=486640 RepID=UPI0013F1E009|nr:uncharacterized protein LOC116850216 [Odontomachus brunneus]